MSGNGKSRQEQITMRRLALVLCAFFLLAASPISSAQSAVSGTLSLNTPAPVAGGVAEFIATIEGLPPLSSAAATVGNVDLQCYQNDVLVLEYPQTTLFYNTSYLGSPYVIDFPLNFSGAAICEAHLYTYKLAGSNKAPKRTKANTLATVSFLVNP